MLDDQNSYIQKVQCKIEGIGPFAFDVVRDDRIDPVISGNKWRKLKYNIEKAIQNKNEGILTFGGAYSNHLIATAQAGYNYSLKTVGVVRGEELHPESNHTLRSCKKLGMELVFISREAYRRRKEKSFLADWHSRFPNYWIVPEGGANFYGAIGCQEILTLADRHYDHIYVAAGTGATAAGILSATQRGTRVHAVSVLKGDFLREEIRKMLWYMLGEEDVVELYMQRLELDTTSHFGGYGQTKPELFESIRSFYEETGVPLEPIYTGKVLHALQSAVVREQVERDESVLFVHTGGLQGGKTFLAELPFLADL